MAIYHVSKTGNNKNDGSAASPFLTISRAAKVAMEGDTVIVITAGLALHDITDVLQKD